MAQLVRKYNYTAGTNAKGKHVREEFQQIIDLLNSGLDVDNIKPEARSAKNTPIDEIPQLYLSDQNVNVQGALEAILTYLRGHLEFDAFSTYRYVEHDFETFEDIGGGNFKPIGWTTVIGTGGTLGGSTNYVHHGSKSVKLTSIGPLTKINDSWPSPLNESGFIMLSAKHLSTGSGGEAYIKMGVTGGGMPPLTFWGAPVLIPITEDNGETSVYFIPYSGSTSSGYTSLIEIGVSNSGGFEDTLYVDDIVFFPVELTHDRRYYTKNNLQNSGESEVHWSNITNKPTAIGYVPKGPWVSGTSYVKSSSQIDVVFFSDDGSSYYCKLSHTANVSNAPPNATYWGLLSERGEQGEPGEAGEKWHSGNGAPGAGVGVVGDWYLDLDSGDVWEKTTGIDTWTLRGNIKGPQGDAGAPGEPGEPGPQGPPGESGEKWHSGHGAPTASTGIVGDWYLDLDTADVYEKTGATVWTFRMNIKGPQGEPGSGTGDGDMTKAVYDINDDGSVERADHILGIESAGNSKYYGTNDAGLPGFYDLPEGGAGSGSSVLKPIITPSLRPLSPGGGQIYAMSRSSSVPVFVTDDGYVTANFSDFFLIASGASIEFIDSVGDTVIACDYTGQTYYCADFFSDPTFVAGTLLPSTPISMAVGLNGICLICLHDGSMYKSSDRGQNYTPVTAPPPLSQIWFGLDVAGLVFYGTDGTGIYESTNGGDSWTLTKPAEVDRNFTYRCDTAILEFNIDDSTMHSTILLLGGHESGGPSRQAIIYKKVNANNWVRYEIPGLQIVHRIFISPADPTIIYAIGIASDSDTYTRRVYVSTDQGETWSFSGLVYDYGNEIDSSISRGNLNINSLYVTYLSVSTEQIITEMCTLLGFYQNSGSLCAFQFV